MTAPTIEQVTQWAEQSGMAINGYLNPSQRTKELISYTSLARADLEAALEKKERTLHDWEEMAEHSGLPLADPQAAGFEVRELRNKVAEQEKELERLKSLADSNY